MKIIDRLLVQSFVPPFFVTFFIAVFVLMLQKLWIWIDEIAGKGADIFLLTEMLAYMSASLLPMALPIAVLISSVMVMGNLAEHYELSSLKSAGISLARILIPLLGVVFLISLFSFYCSDRLIPIANLKFKSRLYDIKNQKPTLSLEEGVFNDDFQGFAIRIGDKDANGTSIEKVLMYDQSQAARGQYVQVSAKTGEMFSTPDQRFFVMQLRDGQQYLENKPNTRDQKTSYPFIRTSFDEWTKVFDLSEFDLDRTDEGLFKSHYTMLSVRELLLAIDSIDEKRDKRINNLSYEIDRTYHLRAKKQIDTTAAKNTISGTATKETATVPDSNTIAKIDTITKPAIVASKPQKQRPLRRRFDPQRAILPQELKKDWPEYSSILETFIPRDQGKILNRAKSFGRTAHGSANSAIRTLERVDESRVDHVYSMHWKFSLAFSCIIFLFIGAPMGAIIRKGGFGYPVLISITFFVFFILLNVVFKEVTEGGGLTPAQGAWMPCFIILPIGIFLTYRAMSGAKVIEIDRYIAFFKKIGRALRPSKTNTSISK